MLAGPIVERLQRAPRLDGDGRLSSRAAILVGSLITLLLWVGLAELFVGWM